MYRLFVALRPPPEMRRTLLACMGGVPSARWQSDEQLHLTLRFIGAVDGSVAEEITFALRSITGPQPTIALDGVGTFDRRGIVHSIWARVTPHEPLVRLQRRLDRALARFNTSDHRGGFIPHVTLARLGRANDGVEAFVGRNAALRSEPALLDSFTLYESVLGSGGSAYHIVERYPLIGTTDREMD